MKGAALVTVSSLYRKFLRQVRQLPDVYLQLFYQLKVADDARKILESAESERFRGRVARFSKELRKIEAANRGNVKAFAHILDLAYGRKGKLRWEIMQPLLSDPNAPSPAPIIKEKPDSCPPVYSPELAALLTSAHSRTTKPLQRASLKSPPTLPARADPSSEEARLLGPLSKRRELNIRWRYFTKEWKKVLPPLQLSCKEPASTHYQPRETNDREPLARIGVRAIGMQGAGILGHIERLASPSAAKRHTRRETNAVRNCLPPDPLLIGKSRWVRRRYQQLLGRLPILTYYRNKDNRSGMYQVNLSPNAISASQRRGTRGLAEADAVDMTWLEEGNDRDPPDPSIQVKEKSY